MSSSPKSAGVIYCRVSTKEQVDGTSLESQERYCREWAERHNITILRVFIDKGESAKTADRTEFIKAITFCSQRKNQLGYFIVYKIDRFARSQDDHVSVRATLRRYGVELRSATEPINETPVGRAMEGMISVFAEFDNNVRRERCMGGMMERARQGFWVWRAPLGYRRNAPGANLTPDPVLAPYIRLAFAEYAKGTYTYQSLADFLSARGMRTPQGKRPSCQLLHKILTNPAYCGVIEAWGERHEAKFEPLIPRDLFERCQPGYKAAREERRARAHDNPIFPLRRVVCTACHGRLTGSISRSARGKRYPYYHHQKQNCDLARFLPKASFEHEFMTYLGHISLAPSFEKTLTALVLNTWKRTLSDRNADRLRVERELDSLSRERQQVFDLHRAGNYTDEEFVEQKALLSNRMVELRRLVADPQGAEFPVDAAVAHCLAFGRDSAATWARLDYEGRIRFQKLVFTNGEIRFDGNDFWNSPLASIYRLNQEHVEDKSTLVDLRGQFWNRILDDLKEWLAFYQYLNARPDREAA
jgi:site-specific DNA recombinase